MEEISVDMIESLEEIELDEREEWELDVKKLVIKSLIGRGSFGSVHRGIYDGNDVAVKMLDWGKDGQATNITLRKAFTQEVSIWNKLDHPNIIKLIGAAKGMSGQNIRTDDDKIFVASNVCIIVVEYIVGGTLKSYLFKNRTRKLPFKRVIQLATDIARGLSYLHSHQIVHRDVKTQNILLDEGLKAKISDFGVSRVEAANPNEMTGLTGTLGYMAPEVLDGSPYNRKSDVYSYGICLWEIYCCAKPYSDFSFSEQTSAIVYESMRPKIPKCCPSSLVKVMKRCWNSDPEKRPEMEELVSILESIDTSNGGGMIPPDQPQGCFHCLIRPRGP
ncbi:serine/threonine-protein kinase STY13-like [Cornus florida]|uniref:serine/threonine-protein kinase STY13-like n=1 Tax=Cornus florida TaxID=4283 RepID=UPI0028977FFD|nr:serine/threonine-protein kinase STY13-like [Cornus florida]